MLSATRACNPQAVSDFDAELAELVALTNEHLRWEMDLGARYLPDRVEEARAAARARSVDAEPRRPEPTRPEPTRPEPGRPEPGRPEPARTEPAVPAQSGPPSAAASPERSHLDVVRDEAASCTRCKLHRGRTNSVFARGSTSADVLFVGEGPGYNEDQQGVPFVGKAGQLLDKMIAAMGLGDDDVYICNVVKCRPPENRTPMPDEAAACLPYLEAQIAEVAPKILVALGKSAATSLGVAEEGRSWRGQWGAYRGIPVMSTYHPAFLLRSPEQKRPVWQDLQAVVAALGRQLPGSTEGR